MIHLLRGRFERAARPFTDFLIRHRFTASVLTVIAFLGTVLASVLVYHEIWKLGALLFLVFSLFDALDGLVARSNNTAKPAGAFLDSVMDRFSDSAILFAIILYGFTVENKGKNFGHLSHAVISQIPARRFVDIGHRRGYYHNPKALRSIPEVQPAICFMIRR
jgi:phosphatidylserine synthase